VQLDQESKKLAQRQRLESSQSLPQQQVSPTLLASTKRTKSAPILPSASLPSALRSASGGGRRRKHVMFQLADLKVVDPSSSYEEGPSPELEEQMADFERYEPTASGDASNEANRKSTGNSRLAVLDGREKKRGRGRSGRFFSPVPSPMASPIPSPAPSPALQVSSPLPSPAFSPDPITSAEESGFSGGLNGAADGGSGVGFFELDEELASPALREGNPVDTFDLDHATEEDSSAKPGAAKLGLGIAPSLTVGSVPIDIVRPGPSFVGSYGH
jgi:hypothetical protein